MKLARQALADAIAAIASMRGTYRCAILVVLSVACRQQPVVITTPLTSEHGRVGCQPPDCGDSARIISVTYLGVSGLLIEHEGHVLLTAPFSAIRPSVR
ncbi:MAG: hypothetical protein ACRENK_11075 [Gemmatimonadaceae bacterium]